MRRIVALGLALAFSDPALADPKDEVRGLYAAFVAAQNARDLAAVREVLSDSPDFLWISDGRPVWGRDAMLERMAGFQKAEVWRVEPEYTAARVMVLDSDTAIFHVPLVLFLGSRDKPAQLRWLVEVLCQKEDGAWRIAGLLTAEDKRPQG